MASDSWRTMPFTEAVIVNPSISLEKGKVYPFVEMAAVDPGARSVRESEHREFKSGGARFAPGDTLMARITPCLENGKIARFRPSDGTSFGFGSTEFIVIRGRDGVTTDEFAYYLTKWPEFRQFAIAQMTGSSGRQRVPADSLVGFEASVAPISVQPRIAHILGTLDDKIELHRRMNETLEGIAKAIFKSWFVDFDPVHRNIAHKHGSADDTVLKRHSKSDPVFPDRFQDSRLGRIPKGWKPATLGDVVEILDSKRIPLSGRERAKRQGPYRYYGAAGVLDHVDDYLFNGIHVLMGEDGSVVDDNDHPVLQYVWGRFWVNNHAHVLRGTNYVSNEQLLLFLKQVNIRPYVTGAVQPKLNQRNMKQIPFVLPSPEACYAFNEAITTLFAKLRANSEQSTTLTRMRDALLPKLLSGEIRVKDAKKVAEEVK